MPQPSITEICLKIICLKFHSTIPGANELTLIQEIAWCCLDKSYYLNQCWPRTYMPNSIMLGHNEFEKQNIVVIDWSSLQINFTWSDAWTWTKYILLWCFKIFILMIHILSNSCEIGLSFVTKNPIDDKSTLVQVMAWCRQATSHYLSQCWPRSMSPYGITKPH